MQVPCSSFIAHTKGHVTCLDCKKISKTDRQLLDLRATSVKEQTKLQNTDGKKEQETSGAQTGNDSVRFMNKT